MDHYPEFNVEVQEQPSAASRHDSASSVAKATDLHSPPSIVPSRQPSQTMASATVLSNASIQQTTSDPPTSDTTEPQERKDSIHTDEETEKLKAVFARYTSAPPPFREDQYENKTEEEQLSMRAHDYSKELSRMMGHQFVRGLSTNDTEEN